MSHVFAILANEGGPKTLWDPTILGILVVLSGVVLFCGSTYLLLATNIGARLGFQVAFAGLAGIMVILSLSWVTTQTPLNSPKGRTQLWKTIPCPEDNKDCAVVDKLEDASIEAISSINRDNVKPIEIEKYQSLRSAVEAALVIVQAEGEAEAPEQPNAEFESGALVLTKAPVDAAGIPNKNGTETLKEYILGGETSNLFWHTQKVAAVEFCAKELQPSDAGFDPRFPNGNPNVKPTAPGCDPTVAHRWLLLEYDYGSIRLPAFTYLFFSLAAFAVALYAMHTHELAQRRIAASAAAA